MCHGKFPFCFENIQTRNPISMITADNLHAELFDEEEEPWVQRHCKTSYVLVVCLY